MRFGIFLMLAAIPEMATAEHHRQFDFQTGSQEEVQVDAPSDTSPAGGRATGNTLELPNDDPPLTVAGSSFSPLFRARDVLDTTHWPASAAAKLFRLTEGGDRTGAACTAQFVGPRHLLTAAHCIVELGVGTPFPAFELSIGHDNGVSSLGRDVKVVKAWIPRLHLDSASYDAKENCADLALLKIDQPLGMETGWLGMTAAAPSHGSPSGILHRFSYPNRRGSDALIDALKSLTTAPADDAQSAQIEQALRRRLDDSKSIEPDFSPTDLYYEYGSAAELGEHYIAIDRLFVLPGQSGAALLDQGRAIVGLLSRNYDGRDYHCRLTPETVGAFKALMELPD